MIVKGIVTCWPLQTLDQYNITMVYTLMLEVGTDKPGPGPSLKDLLISCPPANHFYNPHGIQKGLYFEYKIDFVMNTITRIPIYRAMSYFLY